MFARLSSLPLFWQVFGTNALVLVLAFLGLVFGPVTVSVPPHATELVVLVAGLVVMLGINAGAAAPRLHALSIISPTRCVVTTRSHPAGASRSKGGPVVAALAQTFNEMLDRLEFERRESARRALLVQEGERHRIARELHDEVGQTLTGVMLQVEGLSAAIPEDLRDELDELRETARQRRRGRPPDRPPAPARGTRGPRAAERPRGARDRRSASRPASASTGPRTSGLPLV